MITVPPLEYQEPTSEPTFAPVEVFAIRPQWARLEPLAELPARVVSYDEYDPFDQRGTGKRFALILFKQGEKRRVCVTRESDGRYRCWVEPVHVSVNRANRHESPTGVRGLTIDQVGQFLAECAE